MTRAADIAEQLAARALAVCRHYLPNGRRQGNYWVVGDVRNTPGKSMYVRLLSDDAGHKAGCWSDAATGEYGDLLDVIRQVSPSRTLSDAIADAEAIIGGGPTGSNRRFREGRPHRSNHARQASRLFCDCTSIAGTLGERYLSNRAIDPAVANDLRFHSACYCRPADLSSPCAWPALVAPATDASGNLTGVHRIYLDPAGMVDDRLGNAPIDAPKRSLGPIHGYAVRFGRPTPLIVVAEGVENALSVRTAFPDLTVHAALTAGNLAAYIPVASARRLLIALDDDEAGRRSAEALADRATSLGLSVSRLNPRFGDHNRDLLSLGLDAYRRHLLDQMAR